MTDFNPAIIDSSAEDDIRAGLGHLLPAGSHLFFEHGQWWVRVGGLVFFSVIDTSSGLDLEVLP